MRPGRTAKPRGQNWKTFLHPHAEQIWACNASLSHRSLLPLAVRLLYYRIEISESDPRRHHRISHRRLDRTAASGSHCLWYRAEVPHYAPRANAICERLLGSVRRECLDHLLILHEKQLQRVLGAYVSYFNRARPHQGSRQQIPEPHTGPVPADHAAGKVIAFPVLGG